jgi:hypothetical protein
MSAVMVREKIEILRVEDRSKAGQIKPRVEKYFRHRRQVRELFRNVAAFGLNSLIISSAKLCMKTNQLDLRAAFYIFFHLSTFCPRRLVVFDYLDAIPPRLTHFFSTWFS